MITHRTLRASAVLLAALGAGGCALEEGTLAEQDQDGEQMDLGLTAAFGATSSGGYLTVSSGAGLVYKVRESSGDITSIRWNGRELNDTAKGSHIASGLGTAKVTSQRSPSGTTIVTAVATSTLTHYLVTRRNDNTIYMATYVTAEPPVGELRWITRLQAGPFSAVPTSSDIRGGAALESKDILSVDGQSRSKYYGNQRAQELTVRGVTGSGVGVFMAYGNRESSSGGPFFRDIQNQTGGDTEVYNYMNSGHGQTEKVRTNVLYGPYALIFTDGSTPVVPEMGWMSSLGLTGWVQSRGAVSGKVSGVKSGVAPLVGFSNATAQYWCTPDASGAFQSPPMKPGAYTQTLYQGELAVETRAVTVAAGKTLAGQDITSAWQSPAALFQIGEWDGTPLEFKNGVNIPLMHPSDSRNGSWGPVTYTVGKSATSAFPAAQWAAVNDATTIKFNLSSGEVAPHTLRIGITTAHAGGRPSVTVNGWSSPGPAASSQPDSRGLTIGTYRGNNTLYTYKVPASAFVAGTNTMVIHVISGSSGSGFLSPGFSYDAVALDD